MNEDTNDTLTGRLSDAVVSVVSVVYVMGCLFRLFAALHPLKQTPLSSF